jgi:putative SOS response-associated peptidase YedK
MCNLYRMTHGRAEVAKLFGVKDAGVPGNEPALVYPGHPALVVEGGGVRSMHWGFPLSLRGAKGQRLKPRPVNNTRSDHLSSPFWRGSFASRRCLIPLDGYAEAQGEKGRKTRTWIGMPDGGLFACAGLWRASDEWGDCFSMMITEPCMAVAEIHHRMPVILAPEDCRVWLEGGPAEALALCRPWQGSLAVTPTSEAWSGTA